MRSPASDLPFLADSGASWFILAPLGFSPGPGDWHLDGLMSIGMALGMMQPDWDRAHPTITFCD